MNKSELIEAMAQEADISKAAAAKALDGMVNAITEALKKGDTVTLVGFGSFYVGERAERQGRNPKTGEPLTIAAAKTPKFRAGKSLKDALSFGLETIKGRLKNSDGLLLPISLMRSLSRLRQPSCRAVGQNFNRTDCTALLRLVDIA